MIGIRIADIALAVAASLVAAGPSRAAAALTLSGVGQHATVLNDIRPAQRRNNAAIGRVQNSIRSTRPKTCRAPGKARAGRRRRRDGFFGGGRRGSVWRADASPV